MLSLENAWRIRKILKYNLQRLLSITITRLYVDSYNLLIGLKWLIHHRDKIQPFELSV